MKLNITFKTPDAAHYALLDIEDEEKKEEAEEALEKFISSSVYITVEFDTDEGTATVQEAQ